MAEAAADIADRWEGKYASELARYQRFMDDFRSTEAPGFSVLLVALRNVRGLGAVA